MTREEAIEILRERDKNMEYVTDNDSEAFKMAIKALEQEPCEDAISRQAVNKLSKELVHITRDKADFLCNFWEGLQKLSPVTPQSKTGHWFYDKSIENWRCSECKETPKTMGYCDSANFMTDHFKFCNHCGVKMVEPQESEG